MNRDEYVQKMKEQIDDWNARLGEWEVQVQKAQSGARAQYEAQIKQLEKHRDEAVQHLNKTRDASQAAWTEVSKGAENAWKAMQSSFEKAWGEFHKKP
jgi:chromosome segregation ATPase